MTTKQTEWAIVLGAFSCAGVLAIILFNMVGG